MAAARSVFDVLLRGGTVLDGTGSRPVKADVATRGERVAGVLAPGAVDEGAALRVLDVTGKYVCPGFIDIHTHSDQAVLLNRRMESKVRQGVTTEVAGNCGSALAPLQGEALANAQREMARHGVSVSWSSVAQYFEHVLVNGLLVIESGEHTGALPGRVLRRGQD